MPGLVGHTGDGDLGLRGVVGDGGDDGLFHGRILLDDPGARLPGEAANGRGAARGGCGRTRPSAAPAPGRPLAAISSISSKLTRVQPTGLGHDRGIGAEDPGDVGVDLAGVGPERGGERHRGGVGAAAAERGDVAVASRRPGSRRRPGPARRRAPRGAGRPGSRGSWPWCASVSVMIPAWLPVNDEAGDAEVGQRHARAGTSRSARRR